MKQWLVCIICVSAFSGLCEILIPDGKSKKAFKVVSAITLLSVFLYPLKNIDKDSLLHNFTFDLQEVSSDFQSDSDAAVISAYESGIKKALAGPLNSFGINSDCITVECRRSEDEIEIKKITVYVEKSAEETNQKIKAAIKEYLNEEIEIEIISR